MSSWVDKSLGIRARRLSGALCWALTAASCAETPAGDLPEPRSSADLLPQSDWRMWVADAAGRAFILDSGTPRTVLLPEVAGLSPSDFREGPIAVDEWRDLAGFNDGATPLLLADLPPLAGPFDLAGIIGMDLLLRRPFTWDADRDRLIFGDPQGTFDASFTTHRLELEMRGSGRVCFGEDRCAEHGPARALVRVSFEGTELIAMLDSGAVDFTLYPDALPQAVLEDRPWGRIKNEGGSAIRLSRARSVEVGGVRFSDLRLRMHDVTAAVARLRVETGVMIGALLGGAPMSKLHPTFDFARRTVTLRAPRSAPHDIGDFVGIGFGGVLDGECLRVTRLVEGLDAETKGLRFGDCLVEFGRYTPAQPRADILFFGEAPRLPLGTEIALAVRRDTGVERMTVAVQYFVPPASAPRIEALD